MLSQPLLPFRVVILSAAKDLLSFAVSDHRWSQCLRTAWHFSALVILNAATYLPILGGAALQRCDNQ
jgi:hypothetical protein